MTGMLKTDSAPVLLMAVSAAMLGGAYYFEHVEGLAPCQLCHYQRLAWWIALGIACTAYYLRRDPRRLKAGVGLCALAVLAGAGVAGYHAGVEQAWWAGPTACAGDGLLSGSLGELRSAVASQPVVRCDEVPWSLFGVSMAGYNFAIAAVVGALALAALAVEGNREAAGT